MAARGVPTTAYPVRGVSWSEGGGRKEYPCPVTAERQGGSPVLALPGSVLGRGTQSGPRTGVPIPWERTRDQGYRPRVRTRGTPSLWWTDKQTENIIFPNPSDAGGKLICNSSAVQT